MRGGMVDMYTPRTDSNQFQVFEKRLRHIPVKRIAPYPNTSSIIAQPKRSRMVYSPLPKVKALSLRPVNACIDTKVNFTHGSTHGNMHHILKTKVIGEATLCQSAKSPRGNPYDNEQFVRNGQKQSCGYLPSTTKDKLGCCPLRLATAGYSTPPYSTKALNTGAQRNLKLKAVNGKRDTSIPNSIPNDVGCLDSVKTAALSTIKVAVNCAKDDQVLVRESATSSEDFKTSTKVFDGPTTSTALVSSCNGSVKTTGSSQRYSSNFNPQMTSTPQRSRHTTDSTQASSQLKQPCPPATARYDDDLSILLSILEQERKVGKIEMLPLEILAATAENAQYESKDSTASTSTNSFDISNNNSTYLGIRNPSLHTTNKLPAMKAIGAPKAASSPIVNAKIMEPSAAKFSHSRRRRHHAGNVSRVHPAGSVAGLWRPW